MVVQHNIPAMNANRLFGINNSGLSKSLEKLSSGYAINRAGDNAAGLAVSEKMRSQIAGLTQGVKNAQDGISMIQTYEGALTETDSILQRMKTLATQSANGTYQDDVDRDAIQLEFDQLNDELDQIADTDFNGVVMLNGGQMSDGTRADGYGNIDYSTAVRDAKQLGSVDKSVSIATRDVSADATTETATFTAVKNADGTVTWSTNGAGTLENNTSKNGGFTYNGVVVNVDTSKVISGDTITLDITAGKDDETTVSDTIGYNVSTTDGVVAATGATVFSVTVTADKVTSKSMANAINALNGLTIKSTVTTAATVDSSVNGISLSTANSKGQPLDLMKFDDGSKLTITAADKDTATITYVGKDGSKQQIGSIDTSGVLNTDKTTQAGTITTKVGLSQTLYSPEESATVELVEPNAVSASNSNYASTATLTYTDSLTLQAGARTKDSINFSFSYESNGIGELKANMNCSSREDGLNTKNLSLGTQDTTRVRPVSYTGLSPSTTELSRSFYSPAFVPWRGPTTPSVP